MRKIGNAIQNFFGQLNIRNISGLDAIGMPNYQQQSGQGFMFNGTGASAADVRGINITNSTSGATSGTYGLIVNNSGSNAITIGKTSPGWSGSKWTNSPTGEISWMMSGGTIPLSLGVNQTEYIGIGGAGNVVMHPPTANVTLTVTGLAGTNNPAIQVNGGTTTNQSNGIAISAGTSASDTALNISNGAVTHSLFTVFGDGGVNVGSPTGGSEGLGSLNVQTLFINGVPVQGGGNIPLNSQSTNYTLVLTDVGKCVLQANAAGTVTVPTNASVAFPLGTAINIYNNTAGNITIPTAGDTVRFGPTGASGTRTLAENGLATLLKLASTTWVITGSGLS